MTFTLLQEHVLDRKGAMVGRFTLMRMRAYVPLERRGRAGQEARAVLAYHDYRRYDLHKQMAGFEFYVALVPRLAVTPDDLLEAGIVGERHAPDLESDTPSLSEGLLFLCGATRTSNNGRPRGPVVNSN